MVFAEQDLERFWTINMKIELKLKPFMTPNFVSAEKQEQFTRGEGPCFPLKDVDADSLSLLCDQFREDVFKKAGKQDPRLK